MKTMLVREDAVLEPKDPSIENCDDWPTYSLRKIKITSHVTGEPVSLLKAHKDHPVKVVGYLEPIDSEQSHLGIAISSRYLLAIPLIALSSA